jgi:predicted nucleic acid-binding Zn finger protein
MHVRIAIYAQSSNLDSIRNSISLAEPRTPASKEDRRERAQRVVGNLGVKLHRFLPSGTEIWTVVGRECDFLVDIPPKSREYCSCDDFYFRVLSGKVPECYHLTAVKEARDRNMYSVVEFSDEEMPGFLKALISDIFNNTS